MNKNRKVRVVDIFLKKLNYVMSNKQREVLESHNSIVLGGLWAVEFFKDLLYIAPYIKTDIPKKYRELYRINKIPIKIRGYYFVNNIFSFNTIS